MNFAEHLMTLRKQRGWSQEELGNQIGVTRQTVSKWEIGQSTPELEKLVELAILFGMSIDQLVGLEEAGERREPWEAPRHCSGVRSCGAFYEYISPVKVFGLPLVHIHWGLGPRLAKGIIAVGNCAVGVVAIGGSSLGVAGCRGIRRGWLRHRTVACHRRRSLVQLPCHWRGSVVWRVGHWWLRLRTCGGRNQ